MKTGDAIKMKAKIKNALAGVLFILGALHAPAKAQSSGQRTSPIAICYLSNMSAATNLSSLVCANFTGTGSGNILTVSAVANGILLPGMALSGSGVPAGTTIVSQLTGTPGQTGTYQTSVTTTSNSASLTAGGVPLGWGIPAILPGYAAVFAFGANVTWRDDGGVLTSSPGPGGIQLSAGTSMPYTGNFQKFQAIQQNVGAILAFAFYLSN